MSRPVVPKITIRCCYGACRQPEQCIALSRAVSLIITLILPSQESLHAQFGVLADVHMKYGIIEAMVVSATKRSSLLAENSAGLI